MKKLDILIYTIILAIVVGFITFYFTLQKVCADDFRQQCTPTLPIPSDEYLPSITPSTPTSTPTMTLIPTPTAGQSATPTPQIGTPASANIPVAPPDTGRVN